MKKELPLVSIISPNYNGERKYLNNYLLSILNQTYPNIELVITDDCSTDDSLSIIKSYADKFKEKGYSLIVSRLEKNSGAAACINVCLKHVHGEYLIWMDSDDILYDDAVELKMKHMIEHPGVELLIGQGVIVNEKDINKIIKPYQRVKLKKDDFFMDLLKRKRILFCAAHMVKVEALIRAIPSMHIFESRQGQNFQLLLPLAYACKYDYHAVPTYKRVIHSSSHSKMKRDYKCKIDREFEIFDIIQNTINSIPNISAEDKKRYLKIARATSLKVVFGISLINFKIFAAIKYLKEMVRLRKN